MNWFSLDNGAKMTPKRLIIIIIIILYLFCDQLLETDKPTSGTPAI